MNKDYTHVFQVPLNARIGKYIWLVISAWGLLMFASTNNGESFIGFSLAMIALFTFLHLAKKHMFMDLLLKLKIYEKTFE